MKRTEYLPGLYVRKIRTDFLKPHTARIGITVGDLWLNGSHYYCNVDYGSGIITECLNRLEIVQKPESLTIGEMATLSGTSPQKLPA